METSDENNGSANLRVFFLVSQEEVISQARSSFEEAKADHEVLKLLCKSFLKETPPKRELPDLHLECKD